MSGVHFQYGRRSQFTFEFHDRTVEHDGRQVTACRGCQKPVIQPRRRFYCSKACSTAFWNEHIKPTYWDFWRDLAIARDRSRCVLCGEGPMSDADRVDLILEVRYRDQMHEATDPLLKERNRNQWLELRGRRADRVLEVDHIKPVATHPELEFTLENLRTVCRKCHREHGARPKPGTGVPRVPTPTEGAG